MPSHNSGRAAERSPVTVSITRNVNPLRAADATLWMQSGVSIASRWPGYLGSGWMRSSSRSDEWYMLYRFADSASLGAWESSSSRKQWLAQGEGLVEERRVEKVTGLEGWFESSRESPNLATGTTVSPLRPPRWKQTVSVWLAFFPVSLAFALLVESFWPAWGEMWTAPRVFVTTTILTPLMTVWILPIITRVLQPWLTTGRGSLRVTARQKA